MGPSLAFLGLVLTVTGCLTGTAAGSGFVYDPGFGTGERGVGRIFEKGFIREMIPRRDGGITFVGKSRSDNPETLKNTFFAGVLKANGTPLYSFGKLGRAENPLPSVWGNAAGIARAPGGKFYVVGNFREESSSWKSLVYRIHRDGWVDDAFHTYTSNASSASRQTLSDVATDDKGRAIVIGTYRPNHRTSRILLMRFESGGKLDPDFGRGGRVVIGSRNKRNNRGITVIPLSSGRILFGGVLGGYPFVARIDEDGELDRRFGRRGFTTFARGPENKCGPRVLCNLTDLVRTPDGNIRALANFDYYMDSWIPSVIGLRPGGRIDSRFGEGGWLGLGDWGAGSFGARDLAAMDDSSVIVVSNHLAGNAAWSQVMRINPRGRFDRSFGNRGALRINGTRAYGATAMANGGFAIAFARGQKALIQKFNP